MSQCSTLSVGIIGFGNIGQIRSAVIAEDPRLKLIGISDIEISDEMKGIPFFQNYHELIAEKPDIIFVCTSNQHLADASILALETGCHVFCEKPPGRNLSELESILKAKSLKPELKLKFGFNHRYQKSVMRARKIINS